MLICVDLDGTLLDTVPANAASYRAALEELGFTVTDEYYAERCNGGHYTRFLPPLMGGTPSTADVERVHDRKKALYSDFLDVVRPNTALMEILRTMQAAGHDLACVTTGSKQNATEVLSGGTKSIALLSEAAKNIDPHARDVLLDALGSLAEVAAREAAQGLMQRFAPKPKRMQMLAAQILPLFGHAFAAS